MPLRHFTRLLVAAALAAAGAPALAQTADLGVELSLDGDFDTSTTPPKAITATHGFTIGSEETYTATVTNNGQLIVTEFIMNAAIDAQASTSYDVTGCDPVTAGVAFPCKFKGTLNPGDSTDITIGVTYPLPKPLSSGTCPNGAITLTSSVTVSGLKQDATALTDANPADNTATSGPSPLRNWADLSVDSFDGPANVGQGGTYTYTAKVTNKGPCPAPNVRLTYTPDGSLAFANAVSANCTNGASGFAAANRCELGTLAVGASQTVTADFSVIKFPTDQITGAVSNGATVVSRTVGTTAGADDPNSDNDSNSSTAPVDLSSNKGCSTGGAGGLLSGLLALAGVRFARRRKA